LDRHRGRRADRGVLGCGRQGVPHDLVLLQLELELDGLLGIIGHEHDLELVLVDLEQGVLVDLEPAAADAEPQQLVFLVVDRRCRLRRLVTDGDRGIQPQRLLVHHPR
jgi:hypothetical protein